jgi:hypothetical protein
MVIATLIIFFLFSTQILVLILRSHDATTPSTTNRDKPSLLNAQERRLPKNVNGESIAKDTTKEEKARDKRKGEFFRQLIRFYDKVQSTPAIISCQPSGHHPTLKARVTSSSSS